MTEPGAPQRVRVTGPRTGRPRYTNAAAEIDRDSEVGEVYMRSLTRSQLRLAISVVAMLAVSIGSLPLVFDLFPAVREWRFLHIPAIWWVLGLGVYPVVLLLAWIYVRRAERNERNFAELVGRQ